MTSLSRWLDVEVGLDDIKLNALPSTLALLDLHNDNEIKLVVGDLGSVDDGPKLKIFKGTMQLSDIDLPDLPLAVVGFYTNDVLPRSPPVIAVAFSTCIFIYRNLKLFYKYYLPTSELSTSEIDIWKQLINSENHSIESLASPIESLKAIPEKILSTHSRDLLNMTPRHQLEHLEQMNELPDRKTGEVTCITTLKMNSVEKTSISCLVIGTEDGDLLILEPQSFVKIAQAKISPVQRTPYQMIATGLYSVDYRITIATREKCVCLVKRDCLEGRILFTTDDHIIAIEVMNNDHSVVVICADNTYSCYSKKGKKQWCMNLEHRPIALTLVPVLHLGLTLQGIALHSGHLQVYDGNTCRDTVFVREVVSVMKFGQLGQEEHVMIIVTASGSLMLKILKRTADFNGPVVEIESSGNGVQQKPWMIPKKSKLFLEQAMRERENASDISYKIFSDSMFLAMHEAFQLELNWLRLAAAKRLLQAHSTVENSVAQGDMAPVCLSAQVEGLGPVFLVTLSVENTAADKAVTGLSILFHVDPAEYKVSNPYIKIPLLSPGNKVRFPTKIEEIFSDTIDPSILLDAAAGREGGRGRVKALVIRAGSRKPVLAVNVSMPPTDPMMLPVEKMAEFD